MSLTERLYRMGYGISDDERERSHWVCSTPMLNWIAKQFGTVRDPLVPSQLLGLRVEERNDPGGLRLVSYPLVDRR